VDGMPVPHGNLSDGPYFIMPNKPVEIILFLQLLSPASVLIIELRKYFRVLIAGGMPGGEKCIPSLHWQESLLCVMKE
jgi:hypothetical protein